MQHLLIKLVTTSLAVVIATNLFASRIRFDGIESAVLFALVLGGLNATLRPIFLLITLPLNLITLGLFTFVVNALVFWLASAVPVGVRVDGFVGALLGSLCVSVVGLVVSRVLGRD